MGFDPVLNEIRLIGGENGKKRPRPFNENLSHVRQAVVWTETGRKMLLVFNTALVRTVSLMFGN